MIKVTDGVAAPYSRAQFKSDNPGVLTRRNPTAEFLAQYGIFHEVTTSSPSESHVRDGYELVDGVWQTAWRVMTSQEATEALTAKRAGMRVTMRQAQLQLLEDDLLASVDTAIEAMSEPQRSVARIEWAKSGHVERNSPLVIVLGAALSLSDAQLDALFEAAALL